MNDLEKLLELIAGLSTGAAIGLSILSIVSTVISYYIYCVAQEKTAAKLNAGATWMAYVPFARNAQRMHMAKMPMWKLMFVGGWPTRIVSVAALALFSAIFYAMTRALGFIIFAILVIVYAVFCIIETYRYNLIIADTFCYDKPLAFIWLFAPSIGQVFTYIIALSNRVQPNGKSAPAPGNNNNIGANNGGSAAAGSGVNGIEGSVGMYAGAQFKMNPNEEFIIGRDSTLADIVISVGSEKVSRRHCSVKYLPQFNSYQVIDYSLNGTFYGNNRLAKDQPTQLPRGTTLVIGDKHNQFKLM